MSSDEKGFSGREVTALATFGVLATLIGIGAYQIGFHRISGVQRGAGAEMTASQGPAPVNGQALFAGNCAGCHGATAGGGIGPALNTTASWDAGQFKEAVLHGKAPEKELAPTMPRFATTGLDGAPPTDEQVNAIHDYLKSLK
ncbi:MULTISPECIES: c-type cytochrome [Deinococcus]|uniref:Cytochrome c n=1 Tax=Deinococcus cavernae TaxID=2320857 RepID=A0A418V9Z0_9DEIO|nr:MULTISPECIES: cytochrome c [Deinococcus]RJF72889.1 cytochrome c [Deinococcus cavernae]